MPAGSLATLLGPSGCGKTTTLRLAGRAWRSPDAGEVYVGGRCLTSAARTIFTVAEKRRMGMVFQTYAIWPHMTVFENIAFRCASSGVPAAEIRERVAGHAARRSASTASTIVRRPCSPAASSSAWRSAARSSPIPMCCSSTSRSSNLDARLREEMRLELKELQLRVGVTTVFVTHDQAEAMILSDRVFVMNAGRIAQEGTPRQIYEEPRSAFVMDFLGQVDHVQARVARRPDGAYVARADGVSRWLRFRWPRTQPWQEGEAIVLSFRSTDVRVGAKETDGHWRGTIVSVGVPGRPRGVRRGAGRRPGPRLGTR